ncbi:hypothetical protein VTH8203_03103 [Vibrio thalassae]|uniref:Uncharacterized protein n=1 Tax=Vibrio thalassae TaxID=1243014 RepID=A0A240EN80_9VIBR|nr:hypothetical protein [Vibrio thalassae]SNX49455.1 hypothetical protein VTH8203_03103 [Vibrio thalassae]
MKLSIYSAIILSLSCLVSNSANANTLSNEQLCTAGLALAIDKQPRGINTKGLSGKHVLLTLKDGSNDWDYRCDVNRASKVIKIEARDRKLNDAYLKQVIRYDVTNGVRAVEVMMKKRHGGLKSEKYQARQLKG